MPAPKHFSALLLFTLLTTQIGYTQHIIVLGDTLVGQVAKYKIKNTEISQSAANKDLLFLDAYKMVADGTTSEFGYDLKGNNIFERAAGYEYDKIYDQQNQLVEKKIYASKTNAPRKLVAKQTFEYLGGKMKSERSYNYVDGKECLNLENSYSFDKELRVTGRSVDTYKCGAF